VIPGFYRASKNLTGPDIVRLRLNRRAAARPDPVSGAAEERDTQVHDQLDGLVVNMELTLISIIQGVALYFLTDTSRQLLVSMQVAYWPYIIVGLVTIFLFWSRSLIHTFTVIRWPLEFGHNFLYIACTLIEAVMFTQLANLENWFLLGTVYALVVWFLFAFDLGMIRKRRDECHGSEKEYLCDMLERDQLLNVRVLMPGLALFHLAAYLLIHFRPATFVAGSWHLALGIAQLVGGIFYLTYVLGFYRRIAPMIVTWKA
jgi:hypothetical protein